MFKRLSPDLTPHKVTVELPPVALPDFADPAIWNYFTPFNVPGVGEDVIFHAAWKFPGRNQEALPDHTLPHIHLPSRNAEQPDDWRMILNLDPTKPLVFKYINAQVGEENGFVFDEAPGGHYVDESPARGMLQMRLKTFQNNKAMGVAFRAGEVAHTGCAAEILGNRAIIFAQQPYLPTEEDRYAEGATFLATYEAELRAAFPEQG